MIRQGCPRWLALAVPLVALFVATTAAGCGGGVSAIPTSGQDTPTGSGGPFSTRLVVPDAPIVQGTTVEARLEVTNHTGEPRDLAPPGTCKQKWGLGLRGATAEAAPYVTLLCERGPLVIPAGTTRFPLSIRASYTACSQSTPAPTANPSSPLCGPGNTMPLLPAGDYEARVYGLSGIPEPAPVTVHLVPR